MKRIFELMKSRRNPNNGPLPLKTGLSGHGQLIGPSGFVDLDTETPVVLKDWSAQDFSRIYVRFFPHLVTHAKKVLRDEAYAEEAVQDAFLYLMTALPELDSELGVLRFLKWKTRMVALDLVRARAENTVVSRSDFEAEALSEDPDISESLERADDAAIVRLALAQLSPRQREAIVATVFEEKAGSQVASEMGLSENAFRQLLLRARRSFKTAFVGEVDAAGLTVNEALSLAAKRHRQKLISGGSLIIVLFLVVAGIFGSAPGSLQDPFPSEIAENREGQLSELWAESRAGSK